MVEFLKPILDLSVKCGFLKNLEKKSILEKLSFGPLAILLANNFYTEWYKINVISSDLNVFLYSSSLSGLWPEDCLSTYHHALQSTNDQLPFGLVSVLSSFGPVRTVNEPNIQFHTPSQDSTKAYRCLTFIGPKESHQYFYRLQRQRKMWWRKFSTDPERFSIAEENGNGSNEERIHILAKFPWSTEVVETMQNHGSEPLTQYGSLFEAKVGRKKQLPHVIECVCLESPALVTYLCDSYQQLANRTYFRLNYSLAPYKTAFAIDSTDEKADELYQLARYLCLSLRRAGVYTLLSPTSTSKSKKVLETQFASHDLSGIPFTIVITADALINGIVGMRSRDTTLQEQVHVSKLTSYMQKILGIQ